MHLEDINPLHLEDIKNENHPSAFFEAKEYKVLILRYFEEKENNLNVFSLSFLINEKYDFFYFNKEDGSIKKFSLKEFYIFVDDMIDNGTKYLNHLVKKTEDLEESIFENTDTMKHWFELKKQITRIERILIHILKIEEQFYDSIKIIKEDVNLKTGFEDIDEHLNRSLRISQANNLKLDHIYNIRNALMNEKTNSVMYILTVISAIFLPLNLLVGFFGMNTDGLYFSGNPNGTIIVTTILGTTILLMSLLFMKKRWL
ncbi:MAG: CorA family divalent cation transporter [Arcobacteraceae bacterium]|jgi:magnesium transporter|nr:CorA family divalent cation transporter [Arcobacteraceae bacterium]